MRHLAFALLVACSKPATAPAPATPSPAPAPTPAPATAAQPKPDATIEHDPEAPPHRVVDPHQAELAARADTDGTVLFDAKKYPDASAKFREAFTRSPSASYGYDLCRSLYHEGKFAEALTACDASSRLEPDAALSAKISKQADDVKAEARAQHIQLTK